MKRLIRNRLRHRVVVTLKSGAAFEGVLYEADSEALVLREAKQVNETRGPVPVDGELVLFRADVDYLQLP